MSRHESWWNDAKSPASDEYLQLLPLLRRATSLDVTGGYEDFNPKKRKSNSVLARTEDSGLIDRAISGLAFATGERMDWMTPGAPTLVFLEGRTVLAAVRLLLPGYIRCAELWEGDAPLVDGDAIGDLLVGFGTDWLMSLAADGEPLPLRAGRLRTEFQLSPMSTYRALRAAGHGYVESKEAVDSTLGVGEAAATEELRDAAERAAHEPLD